MTSRLSVTSLLNTAALLSMYWICLETSHWCSALLSYRQSSQLHIRHLMRELQLVHLNLLDLLDNHLDVLHDYLLGGLVHGDSD